MWGKRGWRVGWRLWMMAVVAVMVLTACSGNEEQESITQPDQGIGQQVNNGADNEDTILVTARPEAVVEQLDEEEQTKFPGIHIETMVVQNKQYYYAAHFPMTAYEAVNKVIRATVDSRIDDFEEKVVQLKKGSDKSWPFEMNISFELYYADANYLSVLMYDTRFMGGAHLEEEQYVLNLRLPDGEAVQADDIFHDAAYLDVLSELSYSWLRDEAGLEDGELLQAGTAPVPENYSLLTFDQDHVTVHFTNYQVASGAEGTFAVALPYRQLAAWLDEDFVAALGLQAAIASQIEEAEVPGEESVDAETSDGEEAEQPAGDSDTTDDVDSTEEMEEAPDHTQPTPGSEDPSGEPENSESSANDTTPADDTGTGAETDHASAEQPPPAQGGPVVKDKRVALTFDDGPHGEYTAQILDQLSAHGAKATFFILGNRLEFYPDMVKRIVDEGHELGNHTWDHSRLTRLSADEITEQIKKTNEAAQTYAGQVPKFMRPPYGAYNDLVQQTSGVPLVLWSVDTLDWKERDTGIIVQNVLNDVHDGAVILFHDLYETTADAIGEVLVKLGEQGYEFVTVSELFGFDQMENGGVGEVFRRHR